MPTPQSIALQSKLLRIRREAEERDAKKRAKERDIPYLDIATIPVALEAVKKIPETEAKTAQIVGVQIKDRTLAVAVYDPLLPDTKKVLD